MKIAMGADHGGLEVKEHLKASLKKRGIDVVDFGCHDHESVDYPDYAREVALRVADSAVDEGILVCTSGIGMSITANKYPRVRAALCTNAAMAETARTHNDANILVLGGGSLSPDDAEVILDTWLKTRFSGAERHERRIRKINAYYDTKGAPVK